MQRIPIVRGDLDNLGWEFIKERFKEKKERNKSLTKTKRKKYDLDQDKKKENKILTT